MALIRSARWHLAILNACAVLSTFFLFQLIELSIFSLSFRPFYEKPGAFLNPILTNFTTPTPLQPLTVSNNNATYPRLPSSRLSLSEYVEHAKIQLKRIESVRNILFNGTDLNEDMVIRLISYLRRAESDDNYVPPKVCSS